MEGSFAQFAEKNLQFRLICVVTVNALKRIWIYPWRFTNAVHYMIM